MKKIMKKALSLTLALVMMLTLAPMTAMAAETPDLVIGGGIQTAEYDGRNNNGYLYTPEKDGTLKIEFETQTWMCNIYEGTKPSMAVVVQKNGEFTSVADNYVEAQLTAGTTYYVQIQTYDNNADSIMFMTTYTESSSGSAITGAGTRQDPYDITETKQFVNSVGTEQYFKISDLEPERDYKLDILADASFRANYVVTTMTESAMPMMGRVSVTVTADLNGEAMFIIQDYTAADTFNFGWEIIPEEAPLGTMENPEVITTLGNGTGNCVSAPYWCQWTATEAGLFTITVDAEEPAFGVYTVNDAWEYNSKATDNAESVEVVAGDVVLFYVRDFVATTVDFTTSFEAGATLPTEDEDLGGEEEGPNYEWGNAIVVGKNPLAGPSYLYTYTVHEFSPMKVGKYTFTTTDCVMGIVSNNGYWITEKLPEAEYPDDNTVPYTSVTKTEFIWECTDENQSIWIAVLPNENASNITVTREELEIKEIPEYNRSESAEAYVYTGETSTLTYVNVDGKDTVVDKAVYASDGYYHLNDKTGPVLMVNIYDELFSIANAPSTGKVVTTIKDDKGNVVGKDVWNDVLLTYAACADKDTGLYPLTPVLVYFYQTYGAQQELFTENGYVGSQFKNGMGEDAWMFACMYVPNAEDGTIVLPPVVIDPIVKDEEGKVTTTVATEGEVKNIIEAAKEEGKDVVIKTTTEGLTITIANEDLKDATAVKIDVKVEVKEDIKDTTVAKNDKITDKNFVLKVEFAHEGKLPAEATIVIPVPEAISKAYKTLYYYQIMEDGTLKFVCNAPINSDGKAVVTQDHCSDYVLLTEKIVEEVEAPKTGDNTNFALWIAVLGLGVVAIAGSVVMKKREF